MSQKPSLSLSLLLFKYVSFPRAVSVQDGMVVLDWKFDDVNGTYNTTHFEVGLILFNPIWPRGAHCAPPGMTYLKKTQSVYEFIAGLLQSPRT